MVTNDQACFEDRPCEGETAAQVLLELGGKALLIIGFFGVKAALALGAINFAG